MLLFFWIPYVDYKIFFFFFFLKRVAEYLDFILIYFPQKLGSPATSVARGCPPRRPHWRAAIGRKSRWAWPPCEWWRAGKGAAAWRPWGSGDHWGWWSWPGSSALPVRSEEREKKMLSTRQDGDVSFLSSLVTRGVQLPQLLLLVVRQRLALVVRIRSAGIALADRHATTQTDTQKNVSQRRQRGAEGGLFFFFGADLLSSRQ